LIRKIVTAFVLSLLIAASVGFPSAMAQTVKEMRAMEKARATVLGLGVGTTSRVEVKLRDLSKVKGYISKADQDSFTVVEAETGSSKSIAYSDVVEVKKPGGGLSTRTWIIIGGAAATAVVVGIIAKPAFCDGGAQTRFPC
jgi:hypothetical protein